MNKWQNFFLQKMGVDGQGNAYTMHESVSQWGVWCRDIPFKLLDKAKDPSKVSWLDEHGDDEYIPSTGVYLEAYTMKVDFGCKLTSAVSDVREKVGLFLTYLRESGMLMLYSSHTRIGRKNVRLSSVPDDAKWKNEGGEEWLVFSVIFKVNDPVTDITTNNADNPTALIEVVEE